MALHYNKVSLMATRETRTAKARVRATHLGWLVILVEHRIDGRDVDIKPCA
jgi:hypothetical protein